MTREHLIPAFMYEYQKQFTPFIGWSEPARKMVRGELQVRDVCASCNNGPLSALDDYGRRMLIGNGLLVRNFLSPQLALSYDYDLLVRWLLKLSFNSSRTDGAHSHLFEQYIPYMLRGEGRPKRNEVAVVGYLAGPTVFEGKPRADLQALSLADTNGRCNPFLVRLAWGGFTGGRTNYLLRVNVLGAACFFMLFFARGVLPGHAASSIRGFVRTMAGAKELPPDALSLLLLQGRLSWLDLYGPQLWRQRQT